MSYKLNKKGDKSLVGAFGRRISRPYYEDLNPFVYLQDVITYSAGNPFLKPQFEYNYKLSYNFKGFSVSFIYNNITDIQSETIRQAGDIFIESTGNIGKATFVGGSVNTYLTLTKWWFANVYAELLNNHYKGQLYNTYFDYSALALLIQFNNQFTFGKIWSAELSGFYAGRRVTGQFVNDRMGQINAGVQKKILKGKGSIKYIANTTGTYRNVYNSQAITVGFSYSFGRSDNSHHKRNTGGTAEEENRVRN